MAKAAASAKMAELAKTYGYQLAFFKSDKELWKLFNSAVAGSWDGARFEAAVRGSKWFKKNSETWRQTQQRKYTDPGTYKQDIAQASMQVRRLAGEVGIGLSKSTLGNVASNVVALGWTDDQVRNYLGSLLSPKKMSGTGTFGQVENALRQTAFRNGVRVSDGYITTWAKRITTGAAKIEDAQQSLREQYGKSVAPGFAAELAAGQDLYDLASPYVQTMAKTLEMNPAEIDLFNPTIRRALASTSDADGKAGATPLWQFEKELKKDSRWLATNGARDELDKATRSIGQMFGEAV